MLSNKTLCSWVCFKHLKLFTWAPSKHSFVFSISRLSLSVCVVPLPTLLFSVLMFLDDKATTCRLRCVKLLRKNALWVTVTGTLELLSWIFALFTFSASPQCNTRTPVWLSRLNCAFFVSVCLFSQSRCRFRLGRLACAAYVKRINTASRSADGCKGLR